MIEFHAITPRGGVLVAHVVDGRLVERPEPDLPAAEEAAARAIGQGCKLIDKGCKLSILAVGGHGASVAPA